MIVEQRGRFDVVMGFCREHDEQHLWVTLIHAAMPKSEHITEVFRNLDTCFDPLTVVEQTDRRDPLGGDCAGYGSRGRRRSIADYGIVVLKVAGSNYS